jgi:hypothetical protein
MLAAAFVTFSLSAFQLGACIVIVFASIALAYVLGLDEGKYRGRRAGLMYARELGEKRFNDLAQGRGFPGRGRHD